jgi:hypothetical protein
LVPIAIVTSPVKAVTVLPLSSLAVTWTDGIVAPAVVPLGCTVKTRRAGGPGVMSNGALMASVSPVAAATSV